MTLITVKLIENVLTPEQKREAVEKLTDAIVSVAGEQLRGVTWVVVEEVESGAWGIGGTVLRTQDVAALRAGAVAG